MPDLTIPSGGKRNGYLPWEDYFMAIALVSSERSKDPVTQGLPFIRSTELYQMKGSDTRHIHNTNYLDNQEVRARDFYTVGACIVSPEKRILGTGYNGMPNGCSDDEMPWGKGDPNPLHNKKLFACHAEMNCIINKVSNDIRGCKMYVTLFPCNNCAKIIIQSGIKEVVYYEDKNIHKDEAKASLYMLQKAGITIRKYRPSNISTFLDRLKSRL